MEETRDGTAAEQEQAAIVVQARYRGAQARRRAAATRLVMTRAAGDGRATPSWLDVDVGDWLTAHDEEGLIDEARSDFDVDPRRRGGKYLQMHPHHTSLNFHGCI